MLNLTGTDFDLKNEGVCYQNLELPHLCIMIRKSLYNPSGSSDVDLDVDLFIPELEKMNKIYKFERRTCFICDTCCDADYEGSFNLLLTESMIQSLNEEEMGKWIKNVFAQFQEYYRILNIEFL